MEKKKEVILQNLPFYQKIAFYQNEKQFFESCDCSKKICDFSTKA